MTKDQYVIQLKQLRAWKQGGSVAEYHARFEELSHGILLYNAAYDVTFFVTQFLAGLKEEIRAATALHRPKSMHDASELVLFRSWSWRL